MLNDIFSRASLLARLELGPVGACLSELATALQLQGYATHTIRHYVHAADALGRWLSTNQIPLSSLSEDVIARYVSSLERRQICSSQRSAPAHNAVGLKHLLSLLRQENIATPYQPKVAATPIERVLADYDQYLERTTGAVVLTRHKYLHFARRLLCFAFGSSVPEWSSLRADTITNYVQQETARRRGFGRKHPGSAIRIFLKYLIVQGAIPNGLEAAVPLMRIWKHASLPNHLSTEDLSRLLAAGSYDTDTAIGRRNYAILLLLARLGIRAVEAAHLHLDDVDWRSGSVMIRRGKNHRERSLPLPEDVGQALIHYLRDGRPRTTCREIFLEHTAPFQPLRTASAVTKTINQLFRKAGIERSRSGAHLLRHTAASQMVCRGVSFKDVADVLGHQSLQTTGIYAKLDLGALSQVALPWPGGTQ